MTTGSRQSQLRVLVVDDIEDFGMAMVSYLEKAEEQLQQRCVVTWAASRDGVKDLLEDGEDFDVALVDLGFGVGQPGGLAIVKMLNDKSPSTRIAVHSDLAENGSRLLLTFAIFHWFGAAVLGLLPKAGNGGPKVDYYADAIARLRDGKRFFPDHAAKFRDTGPATDHFKKLAGTPANLMKLRLFDRYGSGSFADMAKASNLDEHYLRTWASNALEHVEAIIKATKGTPLIVDQEVRRVETPINLETGRPRKNNSPQPALAAFARSQSWFLSDPTVIERMRLEK